MGKVLINFFGRRYTVDNFVLGLLKISNLLGFYNIQIENSRPVLHKYVFFNLMSLCFSTIGVVWLISDVFSNNQSKLSSLLMCFGPLILDIVVATATFHQIFYRNEHFLFFQTFMSLTKAVIDPCKVSEFKGPHIASLIFCVGFLVARIIAYPITSHQILNPYFFYVIVNCYLGIMCHFYIFLFGTFMFLIQIMLADLTQSIPSSFDYKFQNLQLKQLLTTFDQLCTAASQLNCLFTYQVFIFFFFLLLLLCLQPYLFSKAKDLTEYVKSFFWLLTTVVSVLSFMKQSTSVSTQVIQFHDRLYRFVIEDFPLTILENNHLEIHLALRRDIVFTAGNYIPIGYMTFHTMLDTTATYLVLLYEYGD